MELRFFEEISSQDNDMRERANQSIMEFIGVPENIGFLIESLTKPEKQDTELINTTLLSAIYPMQRHPKYVFETVSPLVDH